MQSGSGNKAGSSPATPPQQIYKRKLICVIYNNMGSTNKKCSHEEQNVEPILIDMKRNIVIYFCNACQEHFYEILDKIKE